MQKCCAVLFLDLDRFKDINDTLGHSVGDLLLKEVASRIRSLLPAGTLVSRWGGDEFVALLHELDGEEAVERTCQRVVQGLTTPFAVDSYEFAVMASIGAALYPRDGTDPEVLIRNADTAMYEAKESPGRRYAFFASHMHAVAAMRHHIQNELQSAVQTSSLSLYYQPIVDAEHAVVTGAEALLRWRDADGHVHAPADFISIAEDTGAIIPIGMWVVEQAAQQVMQWKRAGIPLSMSVNISPRQLQHPDFAESLSRVLRDSCVEPSLLEVEITESMLVPNAASIMRVLEHIKRMGVRIAVDDFGTGYSAFSYLKQLPLDTLKIDRTFVDGIEREVDRAIAESIIAIAHKLGLRVTAEGVETIFQRRILTDLGCDRLQGFQICRPVPIEAFEEFARVRLAAS
jgi:diguanylate cyclase (GGDEF)-like protein